MTTTARLRARMMHALIVATAVGAHGCVIQNHDNANPMSLSAFGETVSYTGIGAANQPIIVQARSVQSGQWNDVGFGAIDSQGNFAVSANVTPAIEYWRQLPWPLSGSFGAETRVIYAANGAVMKLASDVHGSGTVVLLCPLSCNNL